MAPGQLFVHTQARKNEELEEEVFLVSQTRVNSDFNHRRRGELREEMFHGGKWKRKTTNGAPPATRFKGTITLQLHDDAPF